jgi:hypothetical protein
MPRKLPFDLMQWVASMHSDGNVSLSISPTIHANAALRASSFSLLPT